MRNDKNVARGRKRTIDKAVTSVFERLEARRLFDVVINELLAGNSEGIADQDGDRSDWIELHNTGPGSVNLAGWYLTDDAGDLTKWQFPSTSIPAGGYLLVFASDKNRAVAGQELHTNFRLGADGEYLGLVMPDGTTVADSYAPFPAQSDDVSYGRGVGASPTVNETLVGASSSLRVISPASENAAVDDFWREIGFDDSSWLSGTRSIGFDRDGTGANLLPFIGRVLADNNAEMPTTTNRRHTAYVRYTFNLANKEQLTSLQLQLRFDDGFIAYLNGREVKRVNFGEDFVRPQPQWDSSAGYQMGSSSGLSSVNRGFEATTPIVFDLTRYLPQLVNGTNVLAFHVVNSSSTASGGSGRDLLLEPVLTATRAAGAAGASYMLTPTPGAANGVGTLGIVADTNFSITRGFFDSPFQLDITTSTPGASIRYTLDGSEPTAAHGTLYSGPIAINTTSVVRAVAYKAGHTPSSVGTQTYIFLQDVIQQSASNVTQPYATWGHDKSDSDSASGYNLDDESDWEMDPDIVNHPSWASTIIDDLKAIPTMSIVMNWDDLFGGTPQPGTPEGSGTVAPSPQGIYIHGTSEERRSSVEYFNPNQPVDQFQTDAAIEMQGHSSTLRWNSDKMSFQVKFKFPYGPTDLDYPLFAGTPDGANATTEFDTFILDATYNYSWHHANPGQHSAARFVTDQVIADLQNMAGGKAAHGKYVHLYLNGLYWGLYNVHERPDDSFAEAYFGGDKDDYDVIKHASNDPRQHTWVEGGVSAELRFGQLVSATRAVESNPQSASAYQTVVDLLDVDGFIDYMIVHYYGGNTDWSHNNWYATRNRVEASAKWRFHAWDQEHGFTNPGTNTTGFDQTSTPTELHNNLMANAEYRLRFNDRVQKLMRNGGVLTPGVAAGAYQARVDEISRAIVGESARWGDNRVATPYTRDDFLATSQSVLNGFFPVRTDTVLGQFSSRGWIVSLGAPLLSDPGGEVSPGTQLALSKPAGTPAGAAIYYTLDGSDPRLPGGGVSPSALAYASPITLNASVQVRARIFFDSAGIAEDWSPVVDATYHVGGMFPVRIVELHYHPANHPGVADDEDLEFIELLNTGSDTVSLEGVQITDFTSTPYVFGAGIALAPGQRIVVARDPAVFTSVYGEGINLAPLGYDPANLSNGGERIRLLGPLGETIQDFTWDDIAPWPTSPDGDGPSLQIIDPLGDPADPFNWRASDVDGGTPGAGDEPADTTPPGIALVTYDRDANAIAVEFDEPMDPATVGASDLRIEPIGGGSFISPASVSYNAATNVATFSFGATPLTNGYFRVRVLAGSVADVAGNTLAADFTGEGPDLFALAGDANHDAVVDINDLSILIANWQGTSKTFAQADFNYDMKVDASDLAILAANWQRTADGTLASSAPLPAIAGITPAPPPARRTVRDVFRPADVLT